MKWIDEVTSRLSMTKPSLDARPLLEGGCEESIHDGKERRILIKSYSDKTKQTADSRLCSIISDFEDSARNNLSCHFHSLKLNSILSKAPECLCTWFAQKRQAKIAPNLIDSSHSSSACSPSPISNHLINLFFINHVQQINPPTSQRFLSHT